MKQKSFRCSSIGILLILVFILMGYHAGKLGARAVTGPFSFDGSGKETRIKDGMLSLDEIQVDFGNNNMQESSETVLSDVSHIVQADGLVSPIYRVDIDVTCSEPVTVTMDLDGIAPISGEDDEVLMMGVGVETPNGESILYKFIEPLINDGNATGMFVPAEIIDNTFIRGISSIGKVSKPIKEKLYLGFFYYSSMDEANGHFRVWFPGGIKTVTRDRLTLLTDLESVYQNYLSKNYQYSKRTKWPMDVHIQSLDAEGYYSEGKSGTAGGTVYANTSDYGCIYLNSNLFKDGYRRQRVKEILAHEFFHFVQYNYATPATGATWLDESTATYFEWKESGRIPDSTIKYWHLIYDGVFPEENNAPNGYARMPLIDYLAQNNTENFILETYKNGGPNGDWVNAWHVALQSQGNAWVVDFYDKYFTGETTSYYKPFIFYKDLIAGKEAFLHAGTVLNLTVPDKEEIYATLENDDIPLLGSTTLSIPALGARVVALGIDKDTLENLPDDMDPVVHAEGNIVLTVYEIKGSHVETLGSGNDIRLKDFKEKLDEDVILIALVVGLQESGRADVNFSVQLQPGLILETIELAEEDTSGNIEAAYSAALMAIGDISLDDYGNFNAASGSVKTQREITSSYSLREPTLTIEVTDFNISGTWDANRQTGTGTVKCSFVSERITSEWDEDEECEVTYTQTDNVTSTADFAMEMRGDELFLLFNITYDTDIVTLSECSAYGMESTFQDTDVQDEIELEFLYTTP